MDVNERTESTVVFSHKSKESLLSLSSVSAQTSCRKYTTFTIRILSFMSGCSDRRMIAQTESPSRNIDTRSFPANCDQLFPRSCVRLRLSQNPRVRASCSAQQDSRSICILEPRKTLPRRQQSSSRTMCFSETLLGFPYEMNGKG